MAASPGGSTTVPSYNLSQDDTTIQVRIHCPLAPPNSQPTVVSDGQIFGFTCPKAGNHSYYLPLFLPMPVHSPVLVRDPATSALIVTLRKTQPGVHIPELSLLPPSIHPDIPFTPDFMGGSSGPGSATPGSPNDGSSGRQGYISAEAAALAGGDAYLSTGGTRSPALSPPLPSAPSMPSLDRQPSEDPEIRQAADELIALGLKNENERRRAQGHSPLIFAADTSVSAHTDRGDGQVSFSHLHESSEASTISSSLSAAQDDTGDLSAAGTDGAVRDAITAASQTATSPSPGKMHPYGFRGAFTGPFMPPTSLSGSTPASISSSAASTVDSTSGVTSPMYVRSKVHELQQDVRRLAWGKRRKVAKLREEEKWDEGRYLDGYVDEFGEVADILAWEPEQRLSPSAAAVALSAAVESDEPQPALPFDKTSREAHLAALQFLFAYAYDWRTTQGEHNVESEWTLSVLCRSLVTQCPIEPASPRLPRATSPCGSAGGNGLNSSSGDLVSIGAPRAVSPVSSLSGSQGMFHPHVHHQTLDGAIFGNAGTSVVGTPTLRGTSPDPLGAAAYGASIPMSMAASAAVRSGSFSSSGAVATLGRRPGSSSDHVGSPPVSSSVTAGMAPPLVPSPALSSSLSGSLAAPRRASGLSVSGVGPGGLEYIAGGAAGGVAGPGGPGAAGRGKLPAMRDEPEYDTPLTILRASYRRALTFPLHRSWALCDKVRDDVLTLLRAGLKAVDAALLVVENRLMNSEDSVMHRYAEVWIRPVREWLEKHGSDQSLALLAAEIESLASDLTRDLVGGEVWDLELLEAAARDALDEGHGGYG